MKPRILVLADVYLPGHLAGGPVRSIANMVERLSDEFEWRIVTADRDLRADAPYRAVEIGKWNVVGNAHVFYVRAGPGAAARVLRAIRTTPHDLMYLNSFFSPGYSVIPALARRFGWIPRRPLVIAPRGEFSDRAFSLKSWKKRPYAGIARRLGVYRDAVWHTSSEFEMRDLVRVMAAPAGTVHVARNLSSVVPAMRPDRDAARADARLRVCFLARISRMKNLEYALRVLASVRVPVEFTIHGPVEDQAYWRECRRLIAALPDNVVATYGGPVASDEVGSVLLSHDLLFLPTQGENYGHVIAEALASGLPVLTSDRTPWRGLRDQGVGWDLPLERPEAFVAALEEAAMWTEEFRAEVRERCVHLARAHADANLAVESNRTMFREALSCKS